MALDPEFAPPAPVPDPSPDKALCNAVTYAILNGHGSLDDFSAVRKSVKDGATFEQMMLGVLAAATPKAVWAGAIEAARKSYFSYRPDEPEVGK